MDRQGGQCSGWVAVSLPSWQALLRAHLELGAIWSVGPGSHPLFHSPQHIEYWLMSDKIHERSRAVQSIYLLLQYVVDSLKLAVSFLYPQTMAST